MNPTWHPRTYSTHQNFIIQLYPILPELGEPRRRRPPPGDPRHNASLRRLSTNRRAVSCESELASHTIPVGPAGERHPRGRLSRPWRSGARLRRCACCRGDAAENQAPQAIDARLLPGHPVCGQEDCVLFRVWWTAQVVWGRWMLLVWYGTGFVGNQGLHREYRRLSGTRCYFVRGSQKMLSRPKLAGKCYVTRPRQHVPLASAEMTSSVSLSQGSILFRSAVDICYIK